ncbi:hypothetical protein YB2330_005715 [Saitoella coloradoensis]
MGKPISFIRYGLLGSTTLIARAVRTVFATPLPIPTTHDNGGVASYSDDYNYGQGHVLAKRETAKGAMLGVYVIVIAVLVIFSGIIAGLTLGLMTLDETQLQVLARSGNPTQRRHAEKILPVRRNGHLLLVSLLLANVVVNETLPIISENAFGGGVTAIVTSTVLIVVFAEIIPQAVCSRYGLAVGAFMAWPVRILIWCMFIFSYPIAKLLDYILGQNHGMVYRRSELAELLTFHSQQEHHGGDLNLDAVTIMRGALDLHEKTVENAMTQIEEAFMLHIDTRLNRETIEKIVKSGHSRVPVYDMVADEEDMLDAERSHQHLSPEAMGTRRCIIGCLLVKNLILLDPDDSVPLREVSISTLPTVQSDLPLFDILNSFQEGRSHMAIVVPAPPKPYEPPAAQDDLSRRGSRTRRSSDASSTTANNVTTNAPPLTWSEQEMKRLSPVGIITLEDVLEELIGEEIYDESDVLQLPRTGLAIPLESGQRFILATDRGRQLRDRDRNRTLSTESKKPLISRTRSFSSNHTRSLSRPAERNSMSEVDTRERAYSEASRATFELMLGDDAEEGIPADATLGQGHHSQPSTAAAPSMSPKHKRISSLVGTGPDITMTTSSPVVMGEDDIQMSESIELGRIRSSSVGKEGWKNRFKSASSASLSVSGRRSQSSARTQQS